MAHSRPYQAVCLDSVLFQSSSSPKSFAYFALPAATLNDAHINTYITILGYTYAYMYVCRYVCTYV